MSTHTQGRSTHNRQRTTGLSSHHCLKFTLTFESLFVIRVKSQNLHEGTIFSLITNWTTKLDFNVQYVSQTSGPPGVLEWFPRGTQQTVNNLF